MKQWMMQPVAKPRWMWALTYASIAISVMAMLYVMHSNSVTLENMEELRAALNEYAPPG